MNLANVRDQDLLEELARRKQPPPSPPEPLAEPDYSRLQQTCIHYVNSIAKDGYDDPDYLHSIYERAMEAVYGHGIWEWKQQF